MLMVGGGNGGGECGERFRERSIFANPLSLDQFTLIHFGGGGAQEAAAAAAHRLNDIIMSEGQSTAKTNNNHNDQPASQFK